MYRRYIKIYYYCYVITLKRISLKKVIRRHKGGGRSVGHLPSAFDIIHPIDKIFGTYKERSLYFQLIETICCLNNFHGNHSDIMTSLAAAIVDFEIFNFFSNSNLNTANSEKTTFRDWNLHNCKIH